MQALLLMSERRTMVRLSQDNNSAGHLGVCETLAKNYWPGLQGDSYKKEQL